MNSRARKSRILCPACGKKSWRENGAINRARKQGVPIYCNRKCAAIARQKDNPKSPRNPNYKAMKAEYDREYRRKNRAILKAKHADYHKRTYDPVKAAVKRKERMPLHVEYCRQPKYKAYKKEYDKKIRAAAFGEYADAYKTLLVLLKEIKQQEPDRFERYSQAGRFQYNPINQQLRRMKNASRKLDSF